MAVVDPLGYDELPYPCAPYPHSHPEHLATLARLMGLAAPPLEGARVLEIGCGDGANLLPLAYTMPRARLLGIDLSTRQVEAGQAMAAALGLKAVQLAARDLRDLGPDDGQFDFIIAHGVYSWTPPDVRDALLALLRRGLSPEGIGFISYNVLPGWSDRLGIRAWLLESTRESRSGAARVALARQLMRQLANMLDGDASAHGVALRKELARLQAWSDGYLRHDLLEDHNEPVLFATFVEHLRRHGLRFFAEADFPTMVGHGLPLEATNMQRLARGMIQREQLFDVLAHREFRQSLVIHAERGSPATIDPGVIERMYVGCPTIAPSASSHQRSARHEQPFVAECLEHIASLWPSWIEFEELIVTVRRRWEQHGKKLAEAELPVLRAELATILLARFADRLAELHVAPPAFTTEVSSRPLASPLARRQAQSGALVTNLRHDLANLGQAARQMLPLLDGDKDLDCLARQAPRPDVALVEIARAALLMA